MVRTLRQAVVAVTLGVVMAILSPSQAANAVDNHAVGTNAVWTNGHAFRTPGVPTSGTYDPAVRQVIYTKPFKPGQYDTAVIDLGIYDGLEGGSSCWYIPAEITLSQKSPTGSWSPLTPDHGGVTLLTNSDAQVVIHDLNYNWQVKIVIKTRWRPKIELAYPEQVWVAGFESDYKNGVLVGEPDGDWDQGWGYGTNILYTSD